MVPSWVHDELPALDLGDERLNRRCAQLVGLMADNPEASILQCCPTMAEAKAAYRFLDNPRVSPDALRQAIARAAGERAPNHSRILVAQDTTTLSFTSHSQTEGMGPVGSGATGFFVHTAMAMSSHGTPIGILHQQVWARDAEAAGSRHERRDKPIEDKESYRWVQTLQATHNWVPETTELLTVADREADIFEVFATQRPPNSHLLIRACRDRKVSETQMLFEAAANAPIVGEFDVTVGRSKDDPPRTARLQARICSVTIRTPTHGVHDPSLGPVQLSVIVAEETAPPADQSPVHWVLLTDLPAADLDDARAFVRDYALRWLIERYHYTLKSGCRIEDCQLRHIDRIDRLVALYCVVALRLLWMRYAACNEPDAACTAAFTELEWRTLYAYFNDAPAPDIPLSMGQAVLYVARLGGFKARKGDGDPGVKVLWRGLVRLHDLVIGVRLAARLDVGKG
jgi:hypothetical protein